LCTDRKIFKDLVYAAHDAALDYIAGTGADPETFKELELLFSWACKYSEKLSESLSGIFRNFP
jgi:hypothetical protein